MEERTATHNGITPQVPPASSKPRAISRFEQLNKLYALPAPLRTFPLPTFVPHNPLSLFHILYIWLSQTVKPEHSHIEPVYQGLFSLETRSVHITDIRSIRGLWEQGFYGKGNLSRSEPSWLDRENTRLGKKTKVTSEEVTRKRRAERQVTKWERARKEREAIDQTLQEEAEAEQPEKTMQILPLDAPAETQVAIDEQVLAKEDIPLACTNSDFIAPIGPLEILALPNSPIDIESIVNNTTVIQTKPSSPEEPLTSAAIIEHAPLVTKDQEHVQLTIEEAFFLSYAFGALTILDPDTGAPISNEEFFYLARKTSRFPPQANPSLSPDDPFMINYVVYHHFRSLGWVLRSGTKFSVDYMLYTRGPVFTHAEFAILVLPSYTDPYWRSDPSLEKYVMEKEKRTWAWLSCINRVITQVRKTLMLTYVDIPRPVDVERERVLGIDGVLNRYKVREVVMKRWAANRMRD